MQYMTLRSQNTGQVPLSYLELVQTYAYGMVTFCLVGVADCVFIEFTRIKWLLIVASVGVSCYYSYKETLVDAKKYLTYDVYRRLSMAHVGQACLFALLMRFYFL